MVVVQLRWRGVRIKTTVDGGDAIAKNDKLITPRLYMYKSACTKSARVSLCTCIIPLTIVRLRLSIGLGNLLSFLSSHLFLSSIRTHQVCVLATLVNLKLCAQLHWRLIRSLSHMNVIGSMESRMHAGSESVLT